MTSTAGITTNIALTGLTSAETRFSRSANQIATQSSGSSGTPPTDHVSAVTSLLESRQSFDANAEVLKVTNRVQKRLIDITA